MTTDLNNSTAVIAILATLASADATYQNAAEAFADAITNAREAGIKSGDLDGKPKGKWYVEMQTAIAHARLNPEDLALWSDAKEKASKGSAKNALAMRINSATKRIRDRLAELEVESAEQVIAPESAAETAKVGSKVGTTKTFHDLCADELQACFGRSHKNQASKEPVSIDFKAFRAHLQAAADMLGKPMKVPTLPK